MPIDIDTEAEEMFDLKQLRDSGDSVVLTLTPDILRRAGMASGDEVRVATDFDGTEIRITVIDAEKDKESPAEAVDA